MIKDEAAKFAALLRSDPDVDRKSRAILAAFRKIAADRPSPAKPLAELMEEPLKAQV